MTRPRNYLLFLFLSCFAMPSLHSEKMITLDEAWYWTLQCAPSLIYDQAEVGVRRGEKIQASLLPNPEVGIEVGDMNWQSTGSDEGTELSYGVSQEFEVMPKRRTRTQHAAWEEQAACWAVHQSYNELWGEVKATFVEVKAAESRLKIAKEQETVANEMVEIVRAKVEAGKYSAIHESNIMVFHRRKSVDLGRLERLFAIAKEKLASFWGGKGTAFSGVEFPLLEMEELPSLQDCSCQLVHHPLVAEQDALIAAAQSNMKLQRMEAVPNVTVGAGIDHENDFHTTKFAANITVPIPLFDKNQGNLCKARYELTQKRAKRIEVMTQLQTNLRQLYHEVYGAYEEVQAYEKQVRSLVADTVAGARQGFEQGKLDYLEYLETQRAVFEVEEQYIDALEEYHVKRAKFESLSRGYGGKV